MSDLHNCPARGCSARLPFEVFACRRHWFSLPPRLRARLARDWGSGDLAKYTAARDEAVKVLNR